MLPQVTYGLVSAHNLCWVRNTKENRVAARKEMSPKLVLELTHGFVSAHSPCWLRSSQRILSRCQFRNRAGRANTWIRLRTQPLLSKKYSRKTESMSTQKSSPKLLPQVTHGLVSAHSPCWPKNSQGKLCRCRHRNHHRNYFEIWSMDSSAHTTPVDLEIVKENGVATTQKSSSKCFPEVTHAFFNAHNPYWLRNVKEIGVAADLEIFMKTVSTIDVLIHYRTQPLLSQK
jgi:hypothetical protein